MIRNSQPQPELLPAEFYAQSALVVARQLLGARLVRQLPDGTRLSGRIVETEAYTGVDDMASHGRAKRTPRNLPMWGAPGRAYVYLTYGMHWMLNAVAEAEGHPAAVLIRAIEPLEGLEFIQAQRRNLPLFEQTNGPARLTQALAVDKSFNTVDLTTTAGNLWIERGVTISDECVRTGPRIGLGKTPEPWFSIQWRWWVGGNLHVSVGSGKRG
jgi:DNA-3-methyladenine glycosylase